MNSMSRQFRKVLNKNPGDNAKVSVLLSDYEDADRVIAKLIDQTKSWRESWINLMNSQLGIVTEYEGLYDPIEGSASTGDLSRRVTAPTPELQLHRTFRIKEVYGELRDELWEEVELIDARIIKPTTEARECIAPIRKTMKKRENKRLDYEKAQEKVAKLQRKPGRTPKEDANLAKAEAEVSKCADEFQIADSHLRETLPPLVEAVFSIIPPTINAIVLIQNRMLGLYYTSLHNYCEENHFPSPPPPMDDVISEWSAAWSPIRKQFESFSCVATGKAARMPAGHFSQDDPPADSAGANPPRPKRIPSMQSISPACSPKPSTPSVPPARPAFANNLGVPTEFTTASGYAPSASTSRTPSPGALRSRTENPGGPAAPTNPRPDLTTSNTASSVTSMYHANNSTTSMSSNAAAAAVKKKPPPPPPPKRINSARPPPQDYVVALYTFCGQGAGDLSFEEGDRIRVVRRTKTDQDWWEGELGDRRGSFPANYCRAA